MLPKEHEFLFRGSYYRIQLPADRAEVHIQKDLDGFWQTFYTFRGLEVAAILSLLDANSALEADNGLLREKLEHQEENLKQLCTGI